MEEPKAVRQIEGFGDSFETVGEFGLGIVGSICLVDNTFLVSSYTSCRIRVCEKLLEGS